MIVDLWNDLRYGTRMLVKKPSYSLIAIMTLALGIGANVTIFSFVDTFFYRPLPVNDPYRLVTVEATRQGRWAEGFAYPYYSYIRDHSKSFDGLAAHYSTSPLNVVNGSDSWMANGAVVSANYFSTLGVKPFLGRFFVPEEDSVPDRDPVVVISYTTWQRQFGGDPAVVGKEMRLNETVFRIIGVTPDYFGGISVRTINDLWIPTMMLHVGYRFCDALKDLNCRTLAMIGRLAQGRTSAEANAELTVLANQLSSSFTENKDRQLAVVPAIGLPPNRAKDFVYEMRLLMGTTGLLLLIACANVAALLTVRGTVRRKELIVRRCLGASRARLVRQLMIESTLLALGGGALGLVISFWAKDLLAVFYTTTYGNHQLAYDLSLNPRVVGYLLGLTLLTGLLFGLLPALQATRENLAQALNDEGRAQSGRHSRIRSALVIAQVALSLTLVVAAALLVRSSEHVRKGMTFDPRHVAAMRLRPVLIGYDFNRSQAIKHEVIKRLESLPGVQSVTLATGGGGLGWLTGGDARVRLPDQVAARPEDEVRSDYNEVAPRFFETLKIPLTQGRDFNDRDREGAPPVAIVNETLARRMWPNSAPLERVLMVDERPFQVVGVFKDSQLRSADEGPAPFLYFPEQQNNFRPRTDFRFLIRVAGDPREMLPMLRRAAASVDPNVPIVEDVPLTQQVEGEYKDVLMTSTVLISAGALALFLSMLGLYGVLAFAVSQRTREIGIRMALGAQRYDVLKLIVRQGMTLALVGVVVGLFAARALTRVLASLLYGVTATDPFTFVVIPLSLVLIALLACWIPARRATDVDPLEALRYE